MTTFIRGAEAFLFVLVSSFLSQVTVGGTPVDLTTPEGQSRVVTALLAALGIAFRHWTAVQGQRNRNDAATASQPTHQAVVTTPTPSQDKRQGM